MTILNIFINFINQLLNFEILNIKLATYLITITIVIVLFKIIKHIAE